MNFKKTSLLAVSALAIGLLATVPAWAAGSHSDDHHEESSSYGEPGMAKDVTRTINLNASDMEFDIKELKIDDGETVRFVVKNTGDVDHDFTIGPPDVQADHRQEMMEMMESGAAMANQHEEPNAVFLEPGQTKELIWKFGEVKGLEYACNVPGHYEAGMLGQFKETH